MLTVRMARGSRNWSLERRLEPPYVRLFCIEAALRCSLLVKAGQGGRPLHGDENRPDNAPDGLALRVIAGNCRFIGVSESDGGKRERDAWQARRKQNGSTCFHTPQGGLEGIVLGRETGSRLLKNAELAPCCQVWRILALSLALVQAYSACDELEGQLAS
jgi:hypothetical protein